jgi:hypothetical protein
MTPAHDVLGDFGLCASARTIDRHSAAPETQPYRETARYIGDLLLGGDPATLTEDLALAAVDAIEMRDAYQAALSSALEQLGAAKTMIERQRETIAYLMGADRAEAA